jgi:hypothetical protein
MPRWSAILEEQFDLPTAFVELRDGQSREQKIVGQKGKAFFGLGIDIADTPQRIGVTMCGNKTFQPNGLIAAHSRGRVDRTRREAVEGEIFPGANDEKSRALRQRIEAREIEIGAVHQVERAGFGEH